MRVCQSPGGLLLEQVSCQAGFLELSGHGRSDEGEVTVQGDLTKLASELGKFFDMRQLQLEGRVSAEASWHFPEGQSAEASARLSLDDFQLATGADRVWREKQLIVTLSATGNVPAGAGPDIQQASLQLSTADDRLDAALARAVSWQDAPRDWPVTFTLQGDLARWSARIRPWCWMPDWQLEGHVEAEGELSARLRRWQVQRAAVRLNDLVVRGKGLDIHEPLVHVETAGTWDAEQGTLDSEATTFASSALAFRASELRVQAGTAATAAEVGFRADLSRLAGWMANPQGPPTYQLSGSVLGNITLAGDFAAVSFDGQADIDSFQLAQRRPGAATGAGGRDSLQALWQEKRLSLQGSGRYQLPSDTLQLEDAALTADGLRLTATGEIVAPTSPVAANLRGQAEYDLARMADRWRGYLGSGIQIAGRGSHPFHIEGPIARRELLTVQPASQTAGQTTAPPAVASASPAVVWDQLRAQAQLGWDTLDVYGLRAGPHEFAVELKDAVALSTPWDLAVSEGARHPDPTARAERDTGHPVAGCGAAGGERASDARNVPHMAQIRGSAAGRRHAGGGPSVDRPDRCTAADQRPRRRKWPAS